MFIIHTHILYHLIQLFLFFILVSLFFLSKKSPQITKKIKSKYISLRFYFLKTTQATSSKTYNGMGREYKSVFCDGVVEVLMVMFIYS
jgi:hypothetical protein